MDKRKENMKNFKETEQLCRQHHYLRKAIRDSIEQQKVIAETEVLTAEENVERKYVKTKVIVSGNRSLEAAKEYRGKNICVLNFASATNPGGGVEHGASAQEESLCRCSSLFNCLADSKVRDAFYTPHRRLQDPIYNADCIYTPNVVVFKTDTAIPQVMPEQEWYTVNVISAAAPNLRERPSNAMNPCAGKKRVILKDSELQKIHMERGRRILDIAKSYYAEVLILGAFGCGAFRNSPQVVAEAYKKLMEEYNGFFETIEFAVFCNKTDTANYDTFTRILKGGNV